MSIYIERQKLKAFLPFMIFLLVIFLIGISLPMENYLINELNPSKSIYFHRISSSSPSIAYFRNSEYFKQLIRSTPVNLLWSLLLLSSLILINHRPAIGYEAKCCFWLYLRLHQLLLPKLHRSSYKKP
ncbi:hypothetical protein [Alkaliphilus crotonatoxidans]